MQSHVDTYQWIKTLKGLTSETTRLVVGHYQDIRWPLRGPCLGDALDRLASAVLQLQPVNEQTLYEHHQARLTGFVPQDAFSYMTLHSNAVTKGAHVTLEWRKKSGQVHYATEGYHYSHGRIVAVSSFSSSLVTDLDTHDTTTASTADPPAHLMSQLSFNVGLTDQQRKTKEGLILPYTTPVTPLSHKGAIFYEPDAGDDFDDEDPDDDLDI
ncbi:hypothetical protein BDF14DRAFT_1184817 [Spinellus fusiger]|nr:hypothetical protein BDF14DRAFT_1184817 [Spinellus fusiger]